MVRATDATLADDCHWSAAFTALNETRKKSLRITPHNKRKRLLRIEALMNSRPFTIADDPQFGRLNDNPILLWINARNTLSCLRIFEKFLPIIEDLPEIGLVPQNTVAPCTVTDNRSRIP